MVMFTSSQAVAWPCWFSIYCCWAW